MSTNAARRRGEGGLTIIELIIFIVVVGVGVLGLMAVFQLTSGAGADPLQRKQALLIAEGLLEEVQLARFTYCHPDDSAAETAADVGDCTIPEAVGPLPGEVRPFYNINDYVASFNTSTSFTAGDSTGIITDVASTTAVDYSGDYTAKVTINSEPKLGPVGAPIPALAAGANDANTDVLRIKVVVTYGVAVNGGARPTIELDGYRTRHAPNSVP
ncbi:MSHA biogenesis protein MshD [Massilia glaciei]|uniref:MSHA biogenesis protein MshD n=1 Tax=Massilia glaciei TaxID=1524097 RepID=A0A2U2HJN6_9BURK|nr:MSHA biogenesis protein MshD [Massilia glaciei]PWF47730.1 MSHA biogenesis protein MshD [Massilia glaciei]